jgi:mannose/fructose/N-acetylgalactosamine-specific phosphotransferase system component IID
MSEKNLLFSAIWALLLFFIAWPLAWFCAWWWCLFIAFEDLFPFVKDVTDFLFKIVSWPRIVGGAVIRGDKVFPTPFGADDGVLIHH